MSKKRILFLVNHEIVIYNFRKELVEKLLEEEHEVIISSPAGDKIDRLVAMGASHRDISMDRHGTNILEELKLINTYKKLISEVRPDIIFSFTIKPNIYGAIAAKKYKIPFVANITGLGTAVENPGILQKITIALYNYAFSKVQTVFFQNTENRQFFIDNKIVTDKHKLLPGSGVNLEHFNYLEYPTTNETIEFVFISRIMKEKGIDLYLEAAEYTRKRYPFTRFHIAGFCEEEYENILREYEKLEIIKYHGMVNDIRILLEKTHCTVHPTYYPEGLSNVLLESASSGRPLITTDRSGCREVVNHEVNGYLIEEKNTNELIEKIERFINLDHLSKKNMGIEGRKKVVNEYDRQIIVNAYLNELGDI